MAETADAAASPRPPAPDADAELPNPDSGLESLFEEVMATDGAREILANYDQVMHVLRIPALFCCR